ncbi:phage protein [Streptococcus acidominimus]|uniref:Phage protein n=1 Tax=Streptococcus acidominimus TaxID=1326 RepID=A0A239WZQ6_STRAI|nr:DNA-binding protein [Streptococcus acidominimus]SNV39646.1 phage protein [Streptococcus acidominimus]
MEEWTETIVGPILNKLKAGIQELFKFLDIENTLPLMLKASQCQKMLGVGNYEEFLRITSLNGFPKIERKGKQTRYPRDAVREWFNENWKDI